ncbi:MAG: neocarzinostatin apoprotein domain-containing protein, partial [Acidimicrobiales bacterium]
MTDFEHDLKRMLRVAAGEPPRTVGAEAVRTRARRQQQRNRLVLTAVVALVVGGGLGASLALTAGGGRSVTVTSRSTAIVTASPSDDLTNGQTVEVTVTGFPANQMVSLTECPSPILFPEPRCSTAPTEGVLTTDAVGSASGTLVVELAPAGFTSAFGGSICPPGCLLVASDRSPSGAPSLTAATTLTFTSVSTGEAPEPPGFQVAGASFINADQGWALGTTGCDGCVGVAYTDDGGSAWAGLPTPPTTYWGSSRQASAVSNVAFANAADGYLFAPGLWATDNGGLTWTDEDLTGVTTLTIDGPYVYALSGFDDVGSQQLYRSTLGSNTWQLVTLPVASGQLQSFQTEAAGNSV